MLQLQNVTHPLVIEDTEFDLLWLDDLSDVESDKCNFDPDFLLDELLTLFFNCGFVFPVCLVVDHFSKTIKELLFFPCKYFVPIKYDNFTSCLLIASFPGSFFLLWSSRHL